MATTATGKPGESTRTVSDLDTDIQQLRVEIEKLTKQFAAIGEHGYGTARRAAAEGVEQLRVQGEAAIENLRANVRDVEAQMISSVREKPITSLAIAAGVGYLFAIIARR